MSTSGLHKHTNSWVCTHRQIHTQSHHTPKRSLHTGGKLNLLPSMKKRSSSFTWEEGHTGKDRSNLTAEHKGLSCALGKPGAFVFRCHHRIPEPGLVIDPKTEKSQNEGPISGQDQCVRVPQLARRGQSHEWGKGWTPHHPWRITKFTPTQKHPPSPYTETSIITLAQG